MAASNKPAPAQDDVDDLFGKPAVGVSDDDFAGLDDLLDDLLDEVEEDDSEGWVPKEKGEGIAGIVVKVGETKSDFAAEGTDATVPVVTIESKDGTKWRIIGYSAVLKREITDADPRVGDMMGVKYFGEKLLKSGKFQGRPYKHFGVVVRRKGA